MITCALPWAAALAAPAVWLWWRFLRQGSGRWWRLAVLLALVLAAMQPRLTRDDGGSDVVLVLDRSASMGQARDGQEELVRLAGAARRRDDRLAVVVFGEEPRTAQGPERVQLPRLPDATVDDSGSDLAAALEAATALIAPGRSARVVVHSDGEATGPEPRRAASRLALAGIPVDVLSERRSAAGDAAIADVHLPGAIRQGESFLGAVTCVSDRNESRRYRIRRGDIEIGSGSVILQTQHPVQIPFADRPPATGLVRYAIDLDDQDDRQPANNHASAWLRIEAGERVLVVGGDGTPGAIAKAIAASGIATSTRSAGPLTLADLLGYQALVLAEAPAGKIGHHGMTAIARWVEHLGGGLVMTGGRAGFGCGGWHKSPVEPVLPVSLEVRDEHRRLSVAMAIAIDRSGSMSVKVADGRQKIELAAEGAAAAIELLGERDQICVFAVDTAPHEILRMSHVSDRRKLAREVLGMQSEGGGIYVYEALAAAGRELLRVKSGSRHLLMFADANDSDQHPGDFQPLVADLRRQGITVSVIGMGSDRDKDAHILEEVARLGGGRLNFAETPEDIPRLFAQETVLVARNPWVEGAVRVKPQPMLFEKQTDPLLAQAWPEIPGYNLTYVRPRATIDAWCEGDPRAPACAHWNIGSGRAVALPIPCDDADAPTLPRWAGYAPLLATATRFAAGAMGSAPGGLVTECHGRTATVTLELDKDREESWPTGMPELLLVGTNPLAEPRHVAMLPVDRGRFTAEVALSEQPWIPAVSLTGGAVLGPVLALPMPPEVAPRFGLIPGDEVLATIARDTGGRERRDLLGIYANPPSPGTARDLAPWLVVAALALLVVEIAVRRLGLHLRLPRIRLRLPRRKARPVSVPTTTTEAPAPVTSTPPAPAASAPTPEFSTPPVAEDTIAAMQRLKKRS